MSKQLIILACVCAMLPASAQMCTQKFYLQSGTSRYFTGALPATSLAESSATIGAGLVGFQALDIGISYAIPFSFQGSCDPVKQPIDYAIKMRDSTIIHMQIDSSRFIRAYDSSQVRIGLAPFDSFFYFTPDTNISTNYFVIGRDGPGLPYYTWYSATTMLDSIRFSTDGNWIVQLQILPDLLWSYDSTSLYTATISEWTQREPRARPYGSENHHVKVSIHMMKFLYDTIPHVKARPDLARFSRAVKITPLRIQNGLKFYQVDVKTGSLAPNHIEIFDVSGKLAGTAFLQHGSFVWNAKRTNINSRMYLVRCEAYAQPIPGLGR